MIKSVLTIAGSDSSGGAGIQADIKTITAHGMYAMSAITALTAQNTVGVHGISPVSADFAAAQMDAVFSDIFPDAVKIGMMFSEEIIEIAADRLEHFGAKNIVLDPVMTATSGGNLIANGAAEKLARKLMPLARVVTPNIPETEVLCGFSVKNEKDMCRAAKKLYDVCGTSVLVKGGHLVNDATDILCADGKIERFYSKRIDTQNTHGTGCTLSSAIACGLAAGFSEEDSIRRAKEYLSGALSEGLDFGHGSGPVNHMWNLRAKEGEAEMFSTKALTFC